jgi:hypothetical protein
MIKVIDTMGKELEINENDTDLRIEEPKKKKGHGKNYYNLQVKQLNAELELKLPNEFKGSINNYNHRNVGTGIEIDDNYY